MIRFYSLTLILVIMTCISAKAQGSLNVLEARQGFRDAKMGAPFSAFKGMKLIKPSEFEIKLETEMFFSPIEFLKKYERASDSKKLGNVLLKHIYYEFYKGRLYAINIDADGKDESITLRILQDAYGKGQCTRFSDGSTSCYWFTKTIELSLITMGSNTRISFSGIILSAEITKEQNKRKRQAKFNQTNGL